VDLHNGNRTTMSSEPDQLWLLRHGQSLGNVARDSAGPDVEVLAIAERDMDVPLSPLGVEQARAFGRWLRAQPERPEVVVSSPYVRAVQTAQIAIDDGGLAAGLHSDERLREREFGILDLLTRRGIEERFPFEAERRRRLGKFYHRPPGGESWVDIALRVRSLRDSLALEHPGRRVLLVAHEVVILIWRYLLEGLSEQATLALGRDQPLANCSLTRYATGPDGRLSIDLAGWTAPIEDSGVPVTEDHDAPVAPR
jgi:2,3-bisphosphoglycerate-dependent phosphoglycerate mutase